MVPAENAQNYYYNSWIDDKKFDFVYLWFVEIFRFIFLPIIVSIWIGMLLFSVNQINTSKQIKQIKYILY